MSTKVNFVLVGTLLKSFFRYSTMTSIALSRGIDGYKLRTSYDTWISVGDIFHVFASLTNSTEFLILCWLFFSVGWIPQLYGTAKAHKPEKNYPMRTVLSTIGKPPYGTSKYLAKIIQPALNKSQHKIKNSVEFVNEAKTWKISPTEIQLSYDVVNYTHLFPLTKL